MHLRRLQQGGADVSFCFCSCWVDVESSSPKGMAVYTLPDIRLNISVQEQEHKVDPPPPPPGPVICDPPDSAYFSRENSRRVSIPAGLLVTLFSHKNLLSHNAFVVAIFNVHHHARC